QQVFPDPFARWQYASRSLSMSSPYSTPYIFTQPPSTITISNNLNKIFSNPCIATPLPISSNRPSTTTPTNHHL
ncbi:MAG: hypothetical protein ACKO46_04725, partial [Alphaproteobacteria bacterium]